MSTINELRPTLIWKYFEEILKVPRPSKKEEKIIAYLESFAYEKKLNYKKDTAGNILIYKKAYSGYENKITTILQSHMDMVCEKDNSSKHNFDTDPIQAYIEDGWVKSIGTTLGADNGIGIAAQLAVLDDENLVHGPLECLFTVDEETGLTGAFRLENDFIIGKILLNLDSEDEGELFIGCAGGMDTVAHIPFSKKTTDKTAIAFKITISGLTGGHSGDDINKGYENSNKLLSRLLWNATDKFEIQIYDFQGGNLRNAIPREAYASITLNPNDESKFNEFVFNFSDIVKNELQVSDPNFNIKIERSQCPEFVMDHDDHNRLLNSLHACPNGVIRMTDGMPGLVETSSNLASVKLDNNLINIITSQRSSINSAKRNISDMIKAQFSLPGAEIIQTDNYPGWAPNISSEILKITKKSYKDLFGNEPVIRAIHAGLECGLFLQKYPELDMISFGPTIKGPHSPNERLEISTVEKFWKLLLNVLQQIPDNNTKSAL
jgi:dipeptidase D